MAKIKSHSYCHCGMYFNAFWKLREHIALQNPNYPRRHEGVHYEVARDDWLQIRKAQKEAK